MGISRERARQIEKKASVAFSFCSAARLIMVSDLNGTMQRDKGGVI